MEFRSATRKTYVNRVLWGVFLGVMAVMLYSMLNASISCLDENGCVKTWCDKKWFRSEVIQKINQNNCAT